MKRLTQADIAHALKQHALWSKDTTQGAPLEMTDCDLSFADMRDANLNLASFTKCDMHNVYMRNANLENAHFGKCDLTNANMPHVNATFATFKGSDLSNADFRHAVFYGANLQGVNLVGANFTDANLTTAELSGAKLKGAKFYDTIGNGHEVRTLQTATYMVVVVGDVMQIGCERHLVSEWASFDDNVIYDMDCNALLWWSQSKALVMAFANYDNKDLA